MSVPELLSPAPVWTCGLGLLGTLWGAWPCLGLGTLSKHRDTPHRVTLPLPLQIKPIVSQYLKQKKLPYNEDTYASRLQLFLRRYEELMVHAPPITELVGIQ